MNHNQYIPAKDKTLYFIGVTTGQSSIMKVFPKWSEYLGLSAVIKGFDFEPHASAEEYRRAVTFIKEDPLSLGALVTTHKIDLYQSCKDLFDYLDPFAVQLGEISSISKKDGLLCGHAKDPISSGLALEQFVSEGYWLNHRDSEVLLLGAGGAALAMGVCLTQKSKGENVPKKIIIANRSIPRLRSAEQVLKSLNEKTEFVFLHNPTAEDNDRTLSQMPRGSLIVNATGLGKDAVGSPITDHAVFPEEGLIWEINYRGKLIFMEQAEAQKVERNLVIVDGWEYFIYGWTQVISEVFHINIDTDKLEQLSRLAR